MEHENEADYLKNLKPMSLEIFEEENKKLKNINDKLRAIESEEERKKYPDVQYKSYREYLNEFNTMINELIELNKWD